MKHLIVLSGAALLLNVFGASTVSAQSKDELIAQAVRPLPPDLKAGATVFDYDSATGERKILRQGSNFVECQPKQKDGFTRCWDKVTAGRRDFQAKLRAQGKSDKEVQEATAAATTAGTIKATPYGTMSYRYSDDPSRIQLLWVMSVPGGTPESVGVSTGSQRDAALKGHGLPWLMLPGTPGAHIMIPINNVPVD